MPPAETRFAVLLFTDIVGCAGLKMQHGVPAFSAALVTHNRHFERLARECHLTILQNLGDGYFAEASGVAEAVRFALLFQDAMREGPWGEVTLSTRIGIHAGEISMIDSAGGSGIVAPAADLAARVMSVALGGQILLTRSPFDEARHFIREHPALAGKEMPPLSWMAHGPYLFKGRDEPLEIFEVGAEGLAPLTAPPDAEKAKRAIRPSEEDTLGPRPAVGMEIPGRPGWFLTGLLGKGGFGEVWAGEHAKLRQRRAFKFCFDDERLRALKREVTLVRLLGSALGDRDDIVRIHELKLDTPPFYLESDLAPHGNLLQWAEKQGGLDKISLERRIALVAHTATALAAAHSIGVLHKDIKPTNILIFDGPDGEPRPRLVDFGIGALADSAVLGQYGVTAAGFTRNTIQHSTGTPTYSPPEYLAGRPYTIQGDIYGLGVLLYQLVTSKSNDPLASGWERDIADPLLREDIALCVDGDPARRLPSAADLAERLLSLGQRRAESEENERLARDAAARAEAEAAAIAARLRAARFRRLAAAFAVLSLLAIAGGALAWVNQRKAINALDEVEEQKAAVDVKNTEYRSMLAEAARSDRFAAEECQRIGHDREALAYLARASGYDPDSKRTAGQAVAALGSWRYTVPTAILIPREGSITTANFSPDGGQVVTTSLVRRAPLKGDILATFGNFEGTVQLWDATTGASLIELAGHRQAVRRASFSRNGKWIVTASSDQSATIWDATTGKHLTKLGKDYDRYGAFLAAIEDKPEVENTGVGSQYRSTGHGGSVETAEFSPDGTLVVTGSTDQTARVWNTSTGKCLKVLAGHTGSVESACFSIDGEWVITRSKDQSVCVWSVATGMRIATIADHKLPVNDAQLSHDEKRIATASSDKTVRISETATGKSLLTLEGHSGPVWSARFSPDDASIVTASMDKTARIWNARTGTKMTTLTHEGDVLLAEFSPDGKMVLSASADRTARVWDAATGVCLAILAGHEDALRYACFSSDGKRILTMSRDSTVRIWEAPPSDSLSYLLAGVVDVGVSPTGNHIVTVSQDNVARVWEASTGRKLADLVGHGDTIHDATFSPNGLLLATSSKDGTSRVWNPISGGDPITLLTHHGPVYEIRFSPDSKRVVTLSRDNPLQVWDVEKGTRLTSITLHGELGRSAQFSSAGNSIITTEMPSGTVCIWDAATGKEIGRFKDKEVRTDISSISSLDARLIAIPSSLDSTLRVWDTATGRHLSTLTGHNRPILRARFSADGVRIVTASLDKTARVWNAATGEMLVTLEGHGESLSGAQFSADGARIVTASRDRTVRIWDSASGHLMLTLAGYQGVESAQFCANDTRVVKMSDDRTAQVWDILPSSASQPPWWFANFLRYMAQMRLNADGELEAFKPDDWLALRERLREVIRTGSSQDTPYLRILRRHVPVS